MPNILDDITNAASDLSKKVTDTASSLSDFAFGRKALSKLTDGSSPKPTLVKSTPESMDALKRAIDLNPNNHPKTALRVMGAPAKKKLTVKPAPIPGGGDD